MLMNEAGVIRASVPDEAPAGADADAGSAHPLQSR